MTITPSEKVMRDPSNEELVFECEAVGIPKPKIIWLWSGSLVEDGKVSFQISKLLQNLIMLQEIDRLSGVIQFSLNML